MGYRCAGRVAVEKEWFSLEPLGGVNTFEPPADMQVDAKQVTMAAIQGEVGTSSDQCLNVVQQENQMQAFSGSTVTISSRRLAALSDSCIKMPFDLVLSSVSGLNASALHGS